MRGNSREKWEKARVKIEHRISRLNNPVLFQEDRIKLATYLMQELQSNTPLWGSLKIDFSKNI